METIKVMLVDDKRINLDILSEKLGLLDNIEVLATANNGSQALELMAEMQHKPDIVFMDIEMPIMDGLTAISKGKISFPKTHFIVISVFDNDEKIFQALQLGASGYLLKDTKIADLKKAIEDTINFGAAPLNPILAQKIYSLLFNTNEISKDLNPLTTREIEILKLLSQSKSYMQIATELFISPHTVRKHITNIYEKLQVNSKLQAVQRATENRWF